MTLMSNDLLEVRSGKFLLQAFAWSEHDVHLLDILVGERSLRRGSLALQRETERSEVVNRHAVAMGEMHGQTLNAVREHPHYVTTHINTAVFGNVLDKLFVRDIVDRQALGIRLLGFRTIERIAQQKYTIGNHNHYSKTQLDNIRTLVLIRAGLTLGRIGRLCSGTLVLGSGDIHRCLTLLLCHV